MQRRTTALLLRQAEVRLAPKRPMEAMGTAAAATAVATNAGATSMPPRQAPAASHPAAGTAAPHAPARPASLVTPPAAAAAPSSAGQTGGLRKKKIIRRIVKRKKSSAPSASFGGTAATSAPTAAAAAAQEAEVEHEDHEAAQEHESQHQQRHEEADAASAAAAEEEDGYAAGAEAAEAEETPAASPASAESDARESTARRYAEDMKDLHDVTDESAGTTTSSRKTAMVKGYRIDEVTNLCSPSDAIFARRLPSGGCQFFAWPGTPLAVASKAIMSMPDTIRTVHAVFGRPNTPMDIVMDIDCQVPQEYWTMTKIRPFQMKLLDGILSVLKEEIEKIGESIETQVVLQSPNLKKASFHVHTKLKDAAFADFNSLHGFLCRFQERMPQVDMQIYRPHGMLRMFACMKENHTSAIVVFDDPKWNIGFPRGKVSDAEAALHSVCVRDPATFTRTLTFASPRAYQGGAFSKADEGAEGGEKRLPPQTRLPLTEREAIANASRWLRMANEVEVGEWRTWIGLGLCAYRIAYHFRNAKGLPRPAMEEMLDAWTEASRKCPLKYHQGECETRWAAFSPEKMGDRSDWWGAYKRLSRIEAAAMETAQKDAEEMAERSKRYARRPPPPEAPAAAAAPAASASAPAPPQAEEESAAAPAAPASRGGENLVSASRKLKLKKRKLRSAH